VVHTLLNILVVKPLFVKSGLCVAWLLLIGAAIFRMETYRSDKGAVGITPFQWPASTDLVLNQERSTLLIFVHPACPCSRASVEELNRLLARSAERIDAHVVLYSPDPVPADWTAAAGEHRAGQIPGVTLHEDRNGREARLYGAETSGHVVLYNSRGELLFSGGITAARGHAGDNPGTDAILALLSHRTAPAVTDVFGCPITRSSGEQERSRQ
jgi:hypothetical protein